jgi:ribokinase
MTDRIVVVGSINRDTVVGVDRIPVAGETVLGRHLGSFPGGKGANQAVAAARLGRPVAMVGRVGADAAGTAALEGMAAEGIDTEAVGVDAALPTGSATILVDADGENSIVAVPGANGSLGAAEVGVAAAALEAAAVVLVQLEVPMEAVAATLRWSGGTVVVNAAPARPLPEAIMAGAGVLVVNRSELAVLAGGPEAATRDEVVDGADRLGFAGSVVVTMGAAGAVVLTDARVTEVPSIPVDVVDTTGAGDAFCGGLADGLARGAGLEEATRWAVRVAALATTRLGAQEALPTADEVEQRGG